MTSPPKPPIQLPEGQRSRDPLRDEALAWITHLHSGNETDADWEAFQSWRGFNEAHETAAKKAEKLWERLGPALSHRRGRKGSIITVLAFALGLAGTTFASGVFGPPASFFATYQTSVGEVRRVTLPDGSRVDLDTATSFDVAADQRSIELHSGQIYVEVKPDPGRPFSVKTGDVTVRALGTAFVVRRDGDGTTVAVTEHAVRISHNEDNVRVSAGQSSTYSPKTGLVPPHPIDVEGITAWRRGELAFDGRTLNDVISEINRYHRSRILILDQDVGRLPVSGVFDAADADTLLASIELALPVKVIRLPGLAIVRRDASRPLFPR